MNTAFKDLTMGAYVYYIKDAQIRTLTVRDVKYNEGAIFCSVTFVNGPTLIFNANKDNDVENGVKYFTNKFDVLNEIKNRMEKYQRLHKQYENTYNLMKKMILKECVL